MSNVGLEAPLGVMPVQSDHGDVHTLWVSRCDGKSITVTDFKRVFLLVTGRELRDTEITWNWFAEEDRK